MKSPSPRAIVSEEEMGGSMSRPLPRRAEADAKLIRNLQFSPAPLRWRVGAGQKAARRSKRKKPKFDVFSLFGKEFVHPLSKGGSGSTYILDMNDSTYTALGKVIQAAEYSLRDTKTPLKKQLLVKVSVQGKSTSSKQFIHENMMENAAHVHLLRAQPTTVKCDAGPSLKLHAAPFIPKFHVCAILTGYTRLVCLTVMELVGNALPLRGLESQLTPSTYWEFVKALCSLYAAGVDHSDLHFHNVLLDSQGRIKIIDFGFAVKVPDDIRKAFLQDLARPDSATNINSIIKSRMLRLTNAVQWKRWNGNLTFYNPPYKALQVLYKRLHPAIRQCVDLQARRASSIGCLLGKSQFSC